MSTTNNTNSNNVTKVICQNCGAEVIIPNHETPVTGIAIGKDSGLGTIVLSTVGGGGTLNLKDIVPTAPLNKKQAAAKLAEIAKLSPELASLIATVATGIEDSSYIEVSGLDWRWIPSQCLHMFYSAQGFHQSLISRPYFYSWEVLCADLKRQYKRFSDHDEEGYKDRNRWYNKTVAYEMAMHYIEILFHDVTTMKRHHHKNREYIKLSVRWVNKGKGIHVDELNNFKAVLQGAAESIKISDSPRALYDAVVEFVAKIRQIRWVPGTMSSVFVNAYKAAGAYYTMKDLIMFEGLKMKVSDTGSTDRAYWSDNRKFVEKEESLAALERKTETVVKYGVHNLGYMLLGLLKEFLSYNNFNFKATMEEWAAQSETRRVMRAANRGNRRSRN